MLGSELSLDRNELFRGPQSASGTRRGVEDEAKECEECETSVRGVSQRRDTRSAADTSRHFRLNMRHEDNTETLVNMLVMVLL